MPHVCTTSSQALLVIAQAFLTDAQGEVRVPVGLDRHQELALYGVVAVLEAEGMIETFQRIDVFSGLPKYQGQRLKLEAPTPTE